MAKTVELSCVGMQYRLTKDGRAMLGRSVPVSVILEREPDNEMHHNAIRVLIRDKPGLEMVHIGYLMREVADVYAPRLDAGSLKLKGAQLVEIDIHEGTGVLEVRALNMVKGNKTKRRKRSST